MYAFDQGAGIGHFQPREDGDVQVIIEGIRIVFLGLAPITTEIDVMVYHTSTNHKGFVFLHFGSRSIKQASRAVKVLPE